MTNERFLNHGEIPGGKEIGHGYICTFFSNYENKVYEKYS